MIKQTCYMHVVWVLPSPPSQASDLVLTICDFINKMIRIFIWKGNSNFSVHFIGWNKITKSKIIGGFGIQKMRD